MAIVNLREKRATLNRTLKEQAELSGVHLSTISRIEQGHQLPLLRNMKPVADAYGLTPLDLLASIVAQNANLTNPAGGCPRNGVRNACNTAHNPQAIATPSKKPA